MRIMLLGLAPLVGVLGVRSGLIDHMQSKLTNGVLNKKVLKYAAWCQPTCCICSTAIAILNSPEFEQHLGASVVSARLDYQMDGDGVWDRPDFQIVASDHKKFHTFDQSVDIPTIIIEMVDEANILWPEVLGMSNVIASFKHMRYRNFAAGARGLPLIFETHKHHPEIPVPESLDDLIPYASREFKYQQDDWIRSDQKVHMVQTLASIPADMRDLLNVS